jgi:hypothetical protein
MIKHIGRHGDRKVAILFREVPNEDHMCLVIYPETLPTHIHDSIMRTLESPVGQQATNLAEALHRGILPDGRPQLEALHREGMIKKVPTSQVIVTPTPTSSVKLDELNRIVKEMDTGEAAVKRLQELDRNTGIVDPATKRKAEAEFKRSKERVTSEPVSALVSTDGALDDKTIAANLLSQAKRMEIEAKGMIAEAARMKKDAQRMHPDVRTQPVVQVAQPAPVVSVSPKRGRPSKVKAVPANAVQ